MHSAVASNLTVDSCLQDQDHSTHLWVGGFCRKKFHSIQVCRLFYFAVAGGCRLAFLPSNLISAHPRFLTPPALMPIPFPSSIP
jgi:hypothetical protein